MADDITDPQNADNPTERPDWLPDNFESPEAFAKSYREAQQKITELSEKAKYADTLEENYNNLATTVEQLQAQQTQAQQTQQVHPLIAQYNDAMERGDYLTALSVQNEVNRLTVRQEIQQALPQVQQQVASLADSQAQEIGNWAASTLEARYGDAWNENRDALSHVIETQPWLIPEEAKTNPQVALAALDNVFKIATHGAPSSPQPVQTDAAAEQAKILAQTAAGAGTRITLTGDQAKQEWDAIKAADPTTYRGPQI